MESIHVERLDHIGVIASVVKALGLIDLINARLVPDEQEVITPGEAMAGMILHGLGFANRPVSLPPQFCANKPLDLLLREGRCAEMFNRCTRGRTLDEAYAYGCNLLFQERALAVCTQDGIDLRCNHLDTTSFAQAMTITHGSARDHRPDLKQAVLDLMGSQDGGVPLRSKSGDGPTADIAVFQERAQAVLEAFQNAPHPRSLMADSTLSQEDNAPHLHKRGFLTRMPNTLGAGSQVIAHALTGDPWHRLDATTRSQCLACCHYGMAQRWLVGHAQAALERAVATVTNARQREEEAIPKPLFHLQANRCQTPEGAHEALAALAKRWTSHQVESYNLLDHQRDAGTGRPTPCTPLQASEWQIQVRVRPDREAMWHHQHVKACFVLGPTSGASALSDAEVIAAYKAQSCGEGGCRFLTDPLFFVSSLFVTKPRRMEGLLMGMPLALLVYAGAQRRRRQQWARHNETVPNQSNPPTMSPTFRWVVQLLEGIHRVRVTVQGQVHELIEGLNDVQSKILRLFGEHVCRLYHISPG